MTPAVGHRYFLNAFGWILWGRHVTLGSVQYPHSTIETWHGDMEIWGNGDIKQKTEVQIFSSTCLPFAHHANGSLLFFSVYKRINRLNGLNKLNGLNELNRLNKMIRLNKLNVLNGLNRLAHPWLLLYWGFAKFWSTWQLIWNSN